MYNLTYAVYFFFIEIELRGVKTRS